MAQLAIEIIMVILINGRVASDQEYWSYRAVDRLRDLLPVSAVVRRDCRRQAVAATELVPGDLMLVEAGDRISADARTVVAAALAADESLLTGESVPRRATVGDA